MKFETIGRKLAIFCALGLALLATPSSALLVQPVFLDMRYTGIRSGAAIRVVNDRARPVSVEVTVNSVDIPERGEVTITPIEGDDFLIFPAVATIQPNSTQIFRVRWVGEPLDEGKMFSLTTAELPVEIDAGSQAAVQLLYAIQTIVAIGPNGPRSDLSATDIVRHTTAEGTQGVLILFRNDSAVHGRVNEATLRLSAGSWSHVITSDLVNNYTGLGLVRANGQRWMFFPVDGVPAEGDLAVDADIPEAR